MLRGRLPGHDRQVKQVPLPGVSMKYIFDADGPTPQARAVLRDDGPPRDLGRRLESDHAARPDRRHGDYDNDVWQLFQTVEDRYEAHDLAEQYPDKLEELTALWFEVAEKYDVLPTSDHGSPDLPPAYTYHVPVPPGGQRTYYPNTASVPEACAAGTMNGSDRVLDQ